MVNITDLSQRSSWSRAQTGDVGAIAYLLVIALTTPPVEGSVGPPVKVEVSRRDRTLFVFLTAVPLPQLEDYLQSVYAVITALELADLTELKVLDGTQQRLLNRWQHDFSLQPGPQIAALPSPPPAVSLGPEVPESVDLWHGPAVAPTPGGRRWRMGAIPALVALGFGLAAGAAHYYYDGQRLPTQVTTSAGMLPPGNSSSETGTFEAGTPEAETSQGDRSEDEGSEGAGSNSSEAMLAAEGTAAPAGQDQVAATALTIKAVGDIIPGTDYQRYRLPEAWQYLFSSIQYHLGEADITFGNFESTLTEVPRSAKDTSRGNTFAFRTPPWYASVLKEAGFDVLNVANNHSMDFFEQGFNDTIANIEAAGMKAVGRKGEILYVEAKGKTVAFIGFSTYSEHNSVNDLDSAIALVETANTQADIVVVSFHAGKEGTDATVTRDQNEYFFSENRGNVVRFSRTVIDHGADLVLGHGPHVPRAIELYSQKLIAYSLGNFVGYRSLSTVGPLGTSLILQADLDTEGNFVGGRIIPVALDKNGVPYLDDYFGSVVLVRQFTQRDFPDTPLEIDDMGYIRPQ